jgi:hypothetical protein
MKTDFFSSDENDVKSKNQNKGKSRDKGKSREKENEKSPFIISEDKSDDDINMKKINMEIRKLSEAINIDEKKLKKSSDRNNILSHDRSDISYDQSSESDVDESRNVMKKKEGGKKTGVKTGGKKKEGGKKAVVKKKVNTNKVIKLERITEKDEEEEETDIKSTTKNKSEENKAQLYNEFKKFLLEKKIEEKTKLEREIDKKKEGEEKTIQKMHQLASQLKNKLHIDENTNYVQNFIPNYDLSDEISGIITNELKSN